MDIAIEDIHVVVEAEVTRDIDTVDITDLLLGRARQLQRRQREQDHVVHHWYLELML